MSRKRKPVLLWIDASAKVRKKLEKKLYIGDSICYHNNMWIISTYYSCQEVRDLLALYVHNDAIVFVADIRNCASISFDAGMLFLENSKTNNISSSTKQ